MRKMNRLAALLAILMMSSTMAATTYADEPAAAEATTGKGSITVQNTVKDATYTAYRIFDATANGDAVSYTLPDGVTYTDIDKYFTLSTNGGKTYVQLTDEKADKTALFNWLKGLTGSAIHAGEIKCTDGKDITFSGLPYGYYYIKSSLDTGSGLATAITLKDSNVKAQEKNVVPGWGDGTKTVATADGDDTFSIGETIPYKVTFEEAYNFYIETTAGKSTAHKIYNYILEDTMPSAVTLEKDSFKVTVNGVDINDIKVDTNTANDYTINFDDTNHKFKVTIPWAATQNADNDDFFYHDAPAEIIVTYNGVLTSTANLGSVKDQKNNNKAEFKYNDKISTGEKEKEVYSGKITIDKVEAVEEGKTPKKLAGAKFVVIDKASKDTEGVKYLKYDATANDGKGAFSWLEKKDAAQATVYTTDVNGAAEISGLAAGTYYLLEIEAPQGYNVLTDAQPVTLTKGVDDDKVDHLLMTAQVANNKGLELPSTGGMGTVAFAVVGLIVMAGAAVTLIIKKRA